MSRHNAEMVDTEAGQCLLHVGRRRTGTIIFGLCEIRLRILVTIRCKKFLLANTRLEIRRQQVSRSEVKLPYILPPTSQ
jgi:hypothetical protein